MPGEASADDSFEITSMDFRRELFAAPNVLGVVAGHIHRFSLDMMNGKFQLVLPRSAPVQLVVD